MQGSCSGAPRDHPHRHEMRRMNGRGPFFCSACREVGIGSGYGCRQCVFRVHSHCLSPAATVPGPTQNCSELKLHRGLGSGDGVKLCRACLRPVYGCAYGTEKPNEQEGKDYYFHVTCVNLQDSMKINGVEMELRRQADKAAVCGWCRKKEVVSEGWAVAEMISWTYVEAEVKSNRQSFHVGCVKEMAVESWKSDGLEGRDGEGGIVSMVVDIPEEEGSGIVGKMAKFGIKVVAATLTGDPTELL